MSAYLTAVLLGHGKQGGISPAAIPVCKPPMEMSLLSLIEMSWLAFCRGIGGAANYVTSKGRGASGQNALRSTNTDSAVCIRIFKSNVTDQPSM